MATQIIPTNLKTARKEMQNAAEKAMANHTVDAKTAWAPYVEKRDIYEAMKAGAIS